jgi:hypothetical protein
MTDADKPAFAKLLARLAVALREPAPDVAMLQVYFAANKAREIEFLVMAAEQLMAEAKWFPKTSELNAAALKVEADRRRALSEVQRKSLVRLCTACEDTGWRTNADGRAQRCECQQQRLDELLGRRPFPELPPAHVPIPTDDTSHEEAVSLTARIAQKTGRPIALRVMPRLSPMARVEDDDDER